MATKNTMERHPNLLYSYATRKDINKKKKRRGQDIQVFLRGLMTNSLVWFWTIWVNGEAGRDARHGQITYTCGWSTIGGALFRCASGHESKSAPETTVYEYGRSPGRDAYRRLIFVCSRALSGVMKTITIALAWF